MIGLGLRQLQEALNRKADKVQREFVDLSEEIQKLNAKLLELEGDPRKAVQEHLKERRARQVRVAEEINEWRERARKVIQTRGGQELRSYLNELGQLEDAEVKEAVKNAQWILDSPEEAAQAFDRRSQDPSVQTVVGRLLERGRTEYDLRLGERTQRERAAIEFSNRPGMVQDMAALEELEGAVDDSDPLVRELVMLTLIQLHKTRALRLADLTQADQSVRRLARFDDPYVISSLVAVLESPRTGYVTQEGGEVVEGNNDRARMVALVRLIEWHNEEAKAAVLNRQTDRNSEIAQTARKALELFPGDWRGPIKRKRPAKKA